MGEGVEQFTYLCEIAKTMPFPKIFAHDCLNYKGEARYL